MQKLTFFSWNLTFDVENELFLQFRPKKTKKLCKNWLFFLKFDFWRRKWTFSSISTKKTKKLSKNWLFSWNLTFFLTFCRRNWLVLLIITKNCHFPWNIGLLTDKFWPKIVFCFKFRPQKLKYCQKWTFFFKFHPETD